MVDIQRESFFQRPGLRTDLPAAQREALGCPEAQTNPAVLAEMEAMKFATQAQVTLTEAQAILGFSTQSGKGK